MDNYIHVIKLPAVGFPLQQGLGRAGLNQNLQKLC
jgi:hypothetical protein